MENNFFAQSTTGIAEFNGGEQPSEEQSVKSNMGWSQNFQFSIPELPLSYYPSTNSTSSTSQFESPAQNRHQHGNLQFPFVSPWDHVPFSPFQIGPNGIENGVPNSIPQPMALSELQRGNLWDSYMTKVARRNRKIARQRSASLSGNPSGATFSAAASEVSSSSIAASSGSTTSSASPSSGVTTRRLAMDGADTAAQNINASVQKDLYTFCTPDNKKLRVLLKKELKKSDVGILGRIVLPKKEAEANLPGLSDKEGIPIIIRDVYSTQEWGMRYRFWTNNKSRMYVLENTGDFVKQNQLENGDCITLYEDESKNLYFSTKRVRRPAVWEPSNNHHMVNNYYNNNHLYSPYTHEREEEDEAHLALLIEELKHKEEQEAANKLVTWVDASSQGTCAETEVDSSNSVTLEIKPTQLLTTIEPSSSSSSSSQANMMVTNSHLNDDFDDCFSGLERLPEVGSYSYSLFDQLMNELPDMQGDDITISK